MKSLIYELIYIFTNYFVAYIPIWEVRKFFYMILGVKMGKGSRILMKCIIVCPWRLTIGENTIINENCVIDARGHIEIGNSVTIAMFSKLITGGHDIDSDDFSYNQGKIVISDNVAIFANCILLSNTQIEHHVVFAAGSVIKSGTYTEYGVYGGNPCKYIRKRNCKTSYKQDGFKPWIR